MPGDIAFDQPSYPGGRIPLRCGDIMVGAVFPPAGNNPGRNPWAWRLFAFGDQPAWDGRAASEDRARGHLTAALALTLARAGLCPIEKEARHAR